MLSLVGTPRKSGDRMEGKDGSDTCESGRFFLFKYQGRVMVWMVV